MKSVFWFSVQCSTCLAFPCVFQNKHTAFTKNIVSYCTAKDVMFSLASMCLLVGWLVGFSGGLHKNLKTDFYKTWRIDLSPEQTPCTFGVDLN